MAGLTLLFRGGADLGYVGHVDDQVNQGPGRDLDCSCQGEIFLAKITSLPVIALSSCVQILWVQIRWESSGRAHSFFEFLSFSLGWMSTSGFLLISMLVWQGDAKSIKRSHMQHRRYLTRSQNIGQRASWQHKMDAVNLARQALAGVEMEKAGHKTLRFA